MRIPVVSVCVPTYNGAAYLDECLRGLAAQTFADFEVIVVDDCSKDDTVGIARAWAERDPRFVVHVNSRNLGLVGNWNRCIELARGEWIRFMFQDDLIAPTCLERMLGVGVDGVDFVACARDFLYEGECAPETKAVYARSQDTVRHLFGQSRYTSPLDYCVARIDHLDTNIVGEPSVTMIRRALFARLGSFDPMLVQICDSEMWTRLGSHVGLAFVPEKLVTFRVHAASTTATNRSRPFRTSILEGIIETWLYCEAPQYEQLRVHLRAAGRMKALRHALDTQVNIAFYQARDADRDQPRDPQIRLQLIDIMNRLSGYSRARNRHFVFRMKRMFGLVDPVP